MAPPPGHSTCQPLPAREQTYFKKIVKCYEHKQYKAGLKCAKQILGNPKFTEHGETLSMKGLILNCMGKHDEAQENVKRGLKNDIKSHVCWHVYGLLQRSEKKYDEAIKAYRNALRIDKDNMQILRDLSLLQIQMRDLEGYRDTRYQLLTLRPTNRASWIGYATAYHLLEDFDTALKIVGEFCKSQQPGDYDFEYSELLLYQNMLLRESGRFDDALQKLEENALHIHDRTNYLETRADLLIRLGRLDDAAGVLEHLIDRNPENLAYYEKLEQCKGLVGDDDDSQVQRRFDMYLHFQERKPRAAAPRRIPLTFLTADRFEQVLRPYLASGLRKGIPSLFQNLRPLYYNSDKTAVIERMLLFFVKELEQNGYARCSLDDSSLMESPTTVLWVYYFLAQHYDRLDNSSKAHMYIDRAITHTPTLIELFMTKAKIHKHAGNAIEAAQCMKQAQQLDTADRYVNSKCAKYLLRTGSVSEAEAMCGKFTREGVEPMQNLNEMQCMWFEIECARAFERAGQWGEALKKCHQVDRHFSGIIEDQFDFHTYCVRKMTLCAYMGLLRLEDMLRKHRFYCRAACIAIKIYLRLSDQPFDSNADQVNEADKLTASEIRKQKRKAKKAAAAKNTDKNRVSQNQQNKKNEPELDGIQQEPLLDPEQLLKTNNPLEEAAKFVEPLIQFNCRQLDAYILGFRVYSHKVLLMLQCLQRGQQIDPFNPKLHICKITFLNYYVAHHFEGHVADILQEQLTLLFPNGVDPSKVNKVFKEEHLNSFPHRLAGAKVDALSTSNSTSCLQNWLIRSLEDDKLKGRTWQNCLRLVRSLHKGQLGPIDNQRVAHVADRCQKLFKETTVFASYSQVAINGLETDLGQILRVE